MGRPNALRWRAVCFDLDGVLIDTMPLHARAWQAALKPLGRRVSRETIYRSEGEPGIMTARRLLKPQSSAADVAAVLRVKERSFADLARGTTVNRRLAKLLDALARGGLGLGLVTGTSAAEVRRAVRAQVLARFQVVVTGDRVRRGKPDPEPYRTAFRELRVPGRQTIVVENAPYGIRSAKRAGAGCVIALSSSLPKRFLSEADRLTDSVGQLVTLVRGLAGVD